MAILSIGELLDMGNSAQMSSYVPYSAIDYNSDGDISGISGSAIAGGVDSSVVSSIVSSMVSSKMDASASSSLQPSGDYAYNSSLSSYLPASASGDFITSTAGLAPSGDYAYNSAVSGKLDASASSQFALSGDYAYNSSLSSLIAYSALESSDGVITAISGTAIGGGGGTGSALPSAAFDIDTANMSSTWVSTSTYKIGVKTDADWLSAKADASAISSKLDATASSMFQPSGNYQTAGNYATGASVVIVNDSSLATASDVVYVVVP